MTFYGRGTRRKTEKINQALKAATAALKKTLGQRFFWTLMRKPRRTTISMNVEGRKPMRLSSHIYNSTETTTKAGFLHGIALVCRTLWTSPLMRLTRLKESNSSAIPSGINPGPGFRKVPSLIVSAPNAKAIPTMIQNRLPMTSKSNRFIAITESPA